MNGPRRLVVACAMHTAAVGLGSAIAVYVWVLTHSPGPVLAVGFMLIALTVPVYGAGRLAVGLAGPGGPAGWESELDAEVRAMRLALAEAEQRIGVLRDQLASHLGVLPKSEDEDLLSEIPLQKLRDLMHDESVRERGTTASDPGE